MPLLEELAQTWEKIPERGPFTHAFTHVRQALLIPTFLGYTLVPFPNPGTQNFVLFPGQERIGMMKHWDFSTVQKVHGNDMGNIVLEIRAIRGNQGWVVANFFKLPLCPLSGFAKGEDIYTYGRNTFISVLTSLMNQVAPSAD